MWSFVVSISVFAILVISLILWQRASRKTIKNTAIDQQIHDAAIVAQRRHVQQFGRESTDITKVLNGETVIRS